MDVGDIDRKRGVLWNDCVSEENYGSSKLYQEHVLEQYKLFAATADATSTRRNAANAFFVTLNTVAVGAITFFLEDGPAVNHSWLNVFPLLALLALCFVWWRLIGSYRDLNAAKFDVIHEYETRLPTVPFWLEWEILSGRSGAGSNARRTKGHKLLTTMEKCVPGLFAVLYLVVFAAIICD